MIKEVKRCLEISTTLNAHLIKLTEYTERVKDINVCEADNLILQLVKEAREAAVGLLDIYAEIFKRNTRSRVRQSNSVMESEECPERS